MDIEFTSAGPEHYQAITQLVSSPEELFVIYPVGEYPWTVEALEKLAEIRSDFTVGIVDGKVAAFANLYKVIPGESAFIGNVIVADAYKGRGIGKRLTQYMADLCVSKYSAVPHLSVLAYNSRAMLLYAGLGFKPYDVEACKDMQGEPLARVHMRL